MLSIERAEIRNLETRADTQGDRTGQKNHIAREQLGKLFENFGTPSENVGDIDQPKDPQEWSGALKRMPRSDIAENEGQENIQGVEYPVKQKNQMGRYQKHQKAGANIWGENMPRLPTLRRAALTSLR